MHHVSERIFIPARLTYIHLAMLTIPHGHTHHDHTHHGHHFPTLMNHEGRVDIVTRAPIVCYGCSCKVMDACYVPSL